MYQERTVKAKKSALKDINAMPKKESEKSVSVKPPKVSSKVRAKGLFSINSVDYSETLY